MTNAIKPTLKSEIIPFLGVVITIVSAVYFYYHLPAQVPMHWNFEGNVDRWGSGKSQAIVLPLIIIGIYAMFLLLPMLDPKKERYEQFAKTFHIFKAIFVVFMAVIYVMTGLVGLGYNIPVGVWTPGLIGILFIIIGNYMGKIKPNWFVGIRTPWTMSSEEVWNKTHRFGGKMFILAGLLMMIQIIMPESWRLAIFILTIAVLLIGTIGYSYLVYLKEKKKNEGNK